MTDVVHEKRLTVSAIHPPQYATGKA
jgi:hypothetical protein